MARVLFDGDYLVYAAGGAVQKTRYDISAVDAESLLIDEAILDSMAEVKAWQAEFPEGTEFSVAPLVEAEHESHAFHLVRRSLETVDTALRDKGIQFDHMEVFLTGGGNFRDRIATIRGYKSNRDKSSRPVHYAAIREYLTTQHGAVTVEGIEADDILAIEAAKYDYDPEKVLIVAVDKDLLTVPGLHYNPSKKEFQTVTAKQALVYFYRQVITGDTVDAIVGCWKSGAAVAETSITEDMTEYAMYSRCLELYRASLSKTGCLYAHMSAEDALLENARLLHLLRHHGDVWTPPTSTS